MNDFREGRAISMKIKKKNPWKLEMEIAKLKLAIYTDSRGKDEYMQKGRRYKYACSSEEKRLK